MAAFRSLLVTATLLCLAPGRCLGRDDQSYREALFTKFLADGRVSATFDFSVIWSVHPLRFTSPGNGESLINDVICESLINDVICRGYCRKIVITNSPHKKIKIMITP